jgi:hypothetical protein
MPFWKFFTPPGLWPAETKQAIAQAITSQVYYTIPPFWADVLFIEVSPQNLLVGGKPCNGEFVRIEIDHIAKHHRDSATDREAIKARIEKAIKPFVEGIRYEWLAAETPRDMWHIDGLNPPPNGSESFYKWWHKGNALAWDEEKEQSLKTEALGYNANGWIK